MGTVWRPELCLHNALFDSLKDKEQAELDFEAIATTSFQDPIFNFTWHRSGSTTSSTPNPQTRPGS